MKYNLKPLILAQLNELGRARFNTFAGDIEKDIEATVEETVRELVGPALKRVMRQALLDNHKPKSPQKETQL